MNFTTEQLEYLSNPDNHKIKFDGYEFVWYANAGDGFTVHSLIRSEDANKIASHIHYWLAKYSKELKSRRKSSATATFIQEAFIEKQLFDIAHSDLKTRVKIERMLELDNTLTPKQLSKEFGLPSKSVYRFFS